MYDTWTRANNKLFCSEYRNLSTAKFIHSFYIHSFLNSDLFDYNQIIVRYGWDGQKFHISDRSRIRVVLVGSVKPPLTQNFIFIGNFRFI